MISLEKSERFQQEYNRYQTYLEKIENPKLKAEFELLLKSLTQEVKKINEQHQQLSMRNTLSDVVHDSRNRLSDVRKKLEKIIKDVDRSKKS